ncbi:MAG: hypothetical protein QOH73_1353 [Gaiellaceae bacterium]|nr:hypothetical protein [Gaiellaceae bacterium]
MTTGQADTSYEALFEAHPQPMWVFDRESLRFLAVNEAAVAAYGYARSAFLAMTIADIRPAEDGRALEAGASRHRKQDGSLIDVRVRSNPISFAGRDACLVLVEDVTAESRLEEQLRQSQKMEAIGNLAGGIAHDFNNILLVIRGHSSLLLEELPEGRLRSSVEQIDCAAARAAEFTHQLLAFSRQQALEPEVVDLNALVTEMLAMLDRMLGDVEVDLRLAPDAAPVVVDRARLGQAILNLVVNARDAMPGGGTLTVRTANVERDATDTSPDADVLPGPHVLLQVTDSGIGMDAETQSRVFEPFFTTKEAGSGLGLATVFGLVRQSYGSIALESEPDHGSTFKLYFPSAQGVVHPPQARAEPPALDVNETILLVDDDEDVRTLVLAVLESYGYTVLTAASGAEALQLAERAQGSIDLLMTDMVMPRMTGRELAEKIQALDPRVRVLFTSGFPMETALSGASVELERYGFIEKPYLPMELARKLRELLD